MKRYAVVLTWFFVMLLWGGSVACPDPTTMPPDGTAETAQEVTQETPTPDGRSEQTPPEQRSESVTDEIPVDAPPADTPPADDPPADAGPDAPGTPDQEPINAPAGQWTWVDVVGSKCGYGTQTGFAVNPSTDTNASRLFIYMQGGGACWQSSGAIGSCFGARPSATQLTGYDKSHFDKENTVQAFFFQRGLATNPFAKDHMVFIPYCSGDVYSGDSTLQGPNGQTMHFHGHKNMQLYLARLVATFGNVKEVVISGSSAGGFGSTNNWGLTQQLFGDDVKVHLLNDSGPAIDAKLNLWETWVKAWNFQVPPGCQDCKTSQKKILEHYKTTMLAKGRKMGLLMYDQDQTIKGFFGYLLPANAAEFTQQLTALYDELDKESNAQYFGLVGSSHTMLGNPALKNESGVTLLQWIDAMIKGDASWKSYRK